MSLPPPPGSYGHQPPTGGQPGGGAPQPWSQQPYPGGPSGPPPSGPPPWGPQQQWAGGPQPPSGGGKAKWILGGLAAILAIALVVVITVLVVRPDGGGNGSSNAGGTGSDSEFASANDTGPVNVITDDPTCDAWVGIARVFADTEQSAKWADRNYETPATAWKPEQRTMYETVAKAMTDAADKTASLARQTPHRAMRELYGQFQAYANAFAAAVPSYVAKDDDIAAVADGLSSALSGVCSAIIYHSAAAVAPLISNPEPPSDKSLDHSIPDTPERFISKMIPVCEEWQSSAKKFADDVSDWRAIDANIPHNEWNSEQRSIMDKVGPVMSASADELERMGRASENAIFEDIAVLAAQYRRAFVTAAPNYTPADNSLSATSTYLVNSVLWACKAAS